MKIELFFLTVYLSKQGNDVYTKQKMGLIFTSENAKYYSIRIKDDV
jgi:hypothetical protein